MSAGLILVLLIILVPVVADTTQDYSITYTISLHTDRSALWNIEYRIPVNTPADQAAFEQNTNSSPILSEESIGDLMAQSAKEASTSTGRPMTIENFHRFSVIQSSPTGTYGVIRYSFLWTNFTQEGDTMTMGDAFVGGLYVPVGASLVIELPPGYAVTSAEPAPNEMNGNLIWYGPYSFDPGDPSLVLTPTGIPVTWLVLFAACCIIVAVIAGFLIYRKTVQPQSPEPDALPPKQEAVIVTDEELREVEERILNLVKDAGGELYQSEIVERLILPKSTVSSALNALQARRLIQKIRKGRENLIRVVTDR
jgi:uncharacterized membrane protein